MFRCLKLKLMYKLAEISPIFEIKNMVIISVLATSITASILFLCHLQLKFIAIFSVIPVLFVILFTFKRSALFIDFSVYIEIIQTNKGSVLEVGVVGFNNKDKYCTLTINRFGALRDIDTELLKQYVLENYSARYSPDLDVIYLMDTNFKSFDQANIVKQHIFNVLSQYICRNALNLTNGNRYATYDKKEIKRYSRLFGIFFSFVKKHG